MKKLLFLGLCALAIGCGSTDDSIKAQEEGRNEGKLAAADGLPVGANPYPQSNMLHKYEAWQRGWAEEYKKLHPQK